jgi:translation initiation factor IF-2
MAETSAPKRLSKVAAEFNISLPHLVEFLSGKGHTFSNPNEKLPEEVYALALKEFGGDKAVKEQAQKFQETTLRTQRQAVVLDEETVVTQKDKRRDADDNEVLIKNNTVAGPKTVAKDKPEEKTEKPVAKKEVAEPKAEEVAPVVEEVKPKKEEPVVEAEAETSGPKVLGKIDLSEINSKTRPDKKKAEKEEKPAAKGKGAKKVEPVQEVVEEVKPKAKGKAKEEVAAPAAEEVVKPEETPVEEPKREEPEHHETKFSVLSGPTILGKIELPKPIEKKKPQPVASSRDGQAGEKKKRKRLPTPGGNTTTGGGGNTTGGGGGNNQNRGPGGGGGNIQNRGPGGQNRGPGGQSRGPGQNRGPVTPKAPLTEEEVQKQIKETLARLSDRGNKSKGAKYRREKRDLVSERKQVQMEQDELEKQILKVTEFVTANELSKMMGVGVTDVISTCMSLGMFVSINQRLDAEALAIVAEEFGFKVEFISAEVSEAIKEVPDNEEDLVARSPIVTVMGHVDHGKTSLLDYVRKANVIAGEAGGITQHIGAYSVEIEDGRHITFLDTPGHEAFTAMRARGAKVTDIAIIVIAADDSVMPQTIEAINHAQAANVPMVFAINKVDKPGANPEKIKEQLAGMNILVEDWGGKFQCQEISAKQGKNINLLLEKVLLEAELLELKANPKRNASGTIIESTLDKGRGYVSTILVHNGTLRVGDVLLAGSHTGRVKAMFNERGGALKEAGPATPVVILGLSGAPQAGDLFNVMNDEREARDIATKRMQLQREQGLRTHKHITLDEIGRRIAIGDFKELNVIVKGDVDGSIEALSDSLLKLSTPQIQVNIIHKSVGAVTESDVLLASASNAIVVAFQVRPSPAARRLAEQEEIEIRQYSIIYNAIEEVKAAMEGMLSPEIEEKVVCNIEIRDVFKITKVGTVAGCMVLDGKVHRNTKIRLIRDGIVIYNGMLGSLKRFKDDVKEVAAGFECGLNIENFNDMKVGDIIEGYEEVEVKKKL